ETPASSSACAVTLETALREREVKAGEATEVTVRLANASKETGQAMTIAIVGLPGGLEARFDQLEELREAGAIDFFETRGREVILYWRQLAPGEVKTLAISCV